MSHHVVQHHKTKQYGSFCSAWLCAWYHAVLTKQERLSHLLCYIRVTLEVFYIPCAFRYPEPSNLKIMRLNFYIIEWSLPPGWQCPPGLVAELQMFAKHVPRGCMKTWNSRGNLESQISLCQQYLPTPPWKHNGNFLQILSIHWVYWNNYRASIAVYKRALIFLRDLLVSDYTYCSMYWNEYFIFITFLTENRVSSDPILYRVSENDVIHSPQYKQIENSQKYKFNPFNL